jgi:hypothetical protein
MQGCGKIEGPSFMDDASLQVVVRTPASPAFGNVSITFAIINRERDNASVSLEYSVDNGLNWLVATLANNAESRDLETSHYPGIEHTVQWNSLADAVGCSGNQNVIVKVLPSDANGTSDATDSFIVNNFAFNEAPSVAVDTPAGVQVGNVKISYTLTDTESDCCSITVEYSLDNGAWNPATMGAAGDGKEDLASSPGGVSHDFFWDPVSDNVGTVTVENQVKVRITPKDFKDGNPGESDCFRVNNTGVKPTRRTAH